MHGLGNDFIVLNGLEQTLELSPEQIRKISDRHFGIGCDQVLLIQPGGSPEVDIRYRIFNADGREVEHCGNGIRCIGRYLSQHGYVTGDTILAETINGKAVIYLESDGRIRVNMGVPRFEPADIPVNSNTREDYYMIDLSVGTVSLAAVSMGNPHAVMFVDDVEQTPVEVLGKEIQAGGLFPDGVNVGFMQILDRAHIKVRVFERGVGETLACGTGACAAMVTGYMANKLENEVNIRLKGGGLTVSWTGEGEPVWMIGPATTVYEGKIDL